MLLIACPFCGPRTEGEFVCGGEATPRPAADAVLDEAAWAEHLYARANSKGPQLELWWHKHGCRSWFRVTRDTRDNATTP